MKPRLYIITPVSRPQNLLRISSSIGPLSAWYDWTWLPISDGAGPDLGGGRKRNIGLDIASCDDDAWVYHLDDDNVLHPDFGKLTSCVISTVPHAEILLIEGIRRRDNQMPHFSSGISSRAQMRPASIDTAQMVVKTSVTKEVRWRLDDYQSDGLYAADLERTGATVEVVQGFAAYYNALEGP